MPHFFGDDLQTSSSKEGSLQEHAFKTENRGRKWLEHVKFVMELQEMYDNHSPIDMKLQEHPKFG